MKKILLLMLLAGTSAAQQVTPLTLPVNGRTLAMGGAFVAVADDPQGGFLNPGGIRNIKQLAYDLAFAASAPKSADQFCVAMTNPRTDQGAVFATGFWTQGILTNQVQRYYVPYTGTGWRLPTGTDLGVVLRFPYLSSRDDSIKPRWEALADVSAMQAFGNFRVAAAMERGFGGAAGMVPRRLRLGAAIAAPEGYAFAYEWRGNETDSRMDFHFASAHWGAEVKIGDYSIVRGGLISGADTRLSFGLAVGTLKRGWRTEAAWEVPTNKTGATRWVIGLGYRV